MPSTTHLANSAHAKQQHGPFAMRGLQDARLALAACSCRGPGRFWAWHRTFGRHSWPLVAPIILASRGSQPDNPPVFEGSVRKTAPNMFLWG